MQMKEGDVLLATKVPIDLNRADLGKLGQINTSELNFIRRRRRKLGWCQRQVLIQLGIDRVRLATPEKGPFS